MHWYETGAGYYYFCYNSSSSNNNNNNNRKKKKKKNSNNHHSCSEEESSMEKVERLASENPVVVFSLASCCMCHVLRRLFCSLGVNVTVYELDADQMQGGDAGVGGGHGDLKEALDIMLQSSSSSSSESTSATVLPAVFIGGKLIGGIERVMAAHISGTLVPLLREAGALWL